MEVTKNEPTWNPDFLVDATDLGLVRAALEFEWSLIRDQHWRLTDLQLLDVQPDLDHLSLEYFVVVKKGSATRSIRFVACHRRSAKFEHHDRCINLTSIGLQLFERGWDPYLPGLEFLKSPTKAASVLEDWWDNGPLMALTSELLFHRCGSRGLLRFRGQVRSGWRSFLAWTYPMEHHPGQDVELLRQQLPSNIPLPTVVAYLPEHGLLLTDDPEPTLESRLDFSEAVYRQAGTILSSIHGCQAAGLPAPPPLFSPLWPELLSSLIPEVTELVETAAKKIEQSLAEIDPVAASVIHGGFSLDDLGMSGNRVMLIHLENLYQGDPARDLGCFLASAQALRVRKALPDSGLSWAFLDGYQKADAAFRPRIIAFQRAALLGLAVHCSLVPSRRQLCRPLLETAIAPS